MTSDDNTINIVLSAIVFVIVIVIINNNIIIIVVHLWCTYYTTNVRAFNKSIKYWMMK